MKSRTLFNLKNKSLSVLGLMLILSLGFMACNHSEILPEELPKAEELQTVKKPSLDDLPTEMEFPQEFLAKIQKDEHEFEFFSTGDPTSNGIVIVESLYGDAAKRSDEKYLTHADDEGNSMTAVEVFLAITDSKVAVPRQIAAIAKKNELSSREVSTSQTPLLLLDANYVANSGSRGCWAADIGKAAFESSYCTSQSGVRYCDSDASNQSYRWSNGSVQNTQVNVNEVCGEAILQIYGHYQGDWLLRYRGPFPQKTLSTVSFFSSTAFHTIAVVTMKDNLGYFRTSSRFQ